MGHGVGPWRRCETWGVTREIDGAGVVDCPRGSGGDGAGCGRLVDGGVADGGVAGRWIGGCEGDGFWVCGPRGGFARGGLAGGGIGGERVGDGEAAGAQEGEEVFELG